MNQPVNINFFIDIENGFADKTLNYGQGGSLYVPGGENSSVGAEKILRTVAKQDAYFVFTQDFHPANHISFMTNHPGIMAMRARQLAASGQQESEIMNPLVLPFTNILIGTDGKICGILSGAPETNPEILLPIVDENNRITGVSRVCGAPGDVLGGFLSSYLEQGCIIQTLWSPHCIQGTQSSLLHGNLIDPLKDIRLNDAVLKYTHYNTNERSEVLSTAQCYVLRKGMNPEVDSYGAGRENDRKSETDLRKIVTEIAQELQKKGATEVNLNHGGLATNFCVEFSDADLHEIAVPIFAAYGIKANVRFIEDISFGIPINVPSGEWPDLANSANRMKARGTTTITSERLIAEMQDKPHEVGGGDVTSKAHKIS